MQIVIDIPEEVKQTFDNAKNEDLYGNYYDYNSLIGKAIQNGIPLPKGHGRLIDVGQCDRKLFYQQCGGADSLITVKTAFDMLMSLSTIVEADREE